MKTAHTPGPWTTDFWRCHTKKCINVGQPASEGGKAIVQTIATINVNGDEYSDEEAANARLIAAAPDLLAALEAILVWDDGNLPGDILDRALIVVDKAKGEA